MPLIMCGRYERSVGVSFKLSGFSNDLVTIGLVESIEMLTAIQVMYIYVLYF